VRARRITALLILSLIAFLFLEMVVGPADERARHGAKLETITIDSRDTGRELDTKVIVPKDGGEGRPLLVFLHGRNGGPSDELNGSMYDAIAAQGDRAPIVAFPDGADHSYWHDRADGNWGSYVTDEVIPEVVDRFGADPERVAIGGISMGGYGAFDIARLHPGRFCAVGGHSPAIFAAGGDSPAGAFDDAGDFSRHDVFNDAASDPSPWRGLPVWLDVGTEDSLHTITGRFAAELEKDGAEVSLHEDWRGDHEGDYWRAHFGAYLRFYAAALARC
jgi:poly(3-hydroxybutyrate) depolymerase